MIDWTALGTTIGGILFAMYVAWSSFMQLRMARDQKKAELQRQALLAAAEAQKQALLDAETKRTEEAEKLAKQVKADLDQTDQLKQRQLTTIHTLVNSNMGEEKRDKVELCQKIFELVARNGTPEEIELAKQGLATAKRKFDEHMASQSVVDDKPKNGFSNEEPKPKEP